MSKTTKVAVMRNGTNIRALEAAGPSFGNDFAKLARRVQVLGLKLGDGRKIPVFPTVRAPSTNVSSIAKKGLPHVLRAIIKAMEYTQRDPALAEAFWTSLNNSDEVAMLKGMPMPDVKDLYARFDTFSVWDPNSKKWHPQIIEFNSNDVEGMFYHHLLQILGREVSNSLPGGPEFKFESMLKKFFNWFVKRAREETGKKKISIAVVINKNDHMVKSVEMPRAVRLFNLWGKSHGVTAIVCTWREITWKQGDLPKAKGKPVNAIWKLAGSDEYSKQKRQSDYGKLVMRNPANVYIATPFNARILGVKSHLAALHDQRFQEAGIFTAKERAAIKALVPWSYVLSNGPGLGMNGRRVASIATYVQKNRSQLVIKPVGGSHGEGVLIGPECSQSVWEAKIKAALSNGGKYIAMKYIRPEITLVPTYSKGKIHWHRRYIDTNWYMLGPRVAGNIQRASDPQQGSILNVAQEVKPGQAGGGLVIPAEGVKNRGGRARKRGPWKKKKGKKSINR